jgi:hypothetical protein
MCTWPSISRPRSLTLSLEIPLPRYPIHALSVWSPNDLVCPVFRICGDFLICSRLLSRFDGIEACSVCPISAPLCTAPSQHGPRLRLPRLPYLTIEPFSSLEQERSSVFIGLSARYFKFFLERRVVYDGQCEVVWLIASMICK